MITFQTYWPLVLLAVIPYLWWVRQRTMSGLNPSHLALVTAVRSVLAGLVVLALMQPVFYRSGSWLSVVYMLDVSESVAPESISAAIDWIEETNANGDPAHARFIPFASNSMVFDDLADVRTVPVSDHPAEDAIDQSATNLEDALVRAASSFAPYHLKRLVLITDGNENAGAVKNTALRLRDENVQIFTRPVPARSGNDAWVDAVIVPERVTEEELFPVEVHLYSQIAATGVVELRAGGEVLEARDLTLEPGPNRVAFEARVADSGPVVLEAEVRIERDRFPDNNVFRNAVVVEGPPRILYVEGRAESAQYLAEALRREGIQVDVVSPPDAPESVNAFDAYEAVILSDVRAGFLSPEQMEALASYVGNLGGGFILAAGDSVFGENGYSGTKIEEILPVRFDLEEQPKSVAMVIVLDKSGSMGGTKIELVKEASKAAVDVLKDDHQVGLVAFDYNFYWPVSLQPAANREGINRRISRILAGGETNIYPALEAAYLELEKVEAEIKHVILMSDGRSLPDRFKELVERMAEAKQTVSTVAVGNGADRQLLASIAGWGNGRDYFVEDATRVPQIFAEETQLATQGTLEEEPFQVVVNKSVEAFNGIEFESSPPLLGFVATLTKDTAEVLLDSGDAGGGDEDVKPILARWQYGLGKTVAFTSDVKNRWAAEWLEWEGYGKFWPQLVRETMRRQGDGGFELDVRKDGAEARITVTGLSEDGGFRSQLNAEVRLIDPRQNASIIDLHQTGPGTYEAGVRVDQRGGYLFRLVGEEVNAARILPYSYPDEYRFHPPDVALLREISQITGGRFEAEAGDIFATAGETIVRPTPLWPYLAALALLVYLTDLLLRRLRLFEPEMAPAHASAPAGAHRARI